MKNIQVIDGASNSAYDLFACTDAEFAAIFPGPLQDIEFIEDVIARMSQVELDNLLRPIWQRPVRKPDAQGIHGTLFYELTHKKEYYPNKREADLDRTSRGWNYGGPIAAASLPR